MLNIITVTKDDVQGFANTLASSKILREKFGVLQIVIDSSKEPGKNYVEKLCNSENNVKYFWQEPGGISSAFNYGILNSGSEWLWFINGGDIISKDLDYEFFLKCLDYSNSDVIVFQTNDNKTNKFLADRPPIWALWPPVLSWIPHPATILKKELFNKFGLFDETLKLAMDYELWLKFFSKNIVVDLFSMTISIFNREGASNKLNKKTRAEVAKVIRRYFWIIIKKEFWSLRIILKSLIINLPFVNYKKDTNKDLNR